MGGAGLCAALSYAETAKEQNRTARIAVLERAPKEERGGATRYTTARIRIDDDNNLDPTFVDTVAATHRDADLDYLRTLERETPASIRFVEERGVELIHYPLGLATGVYGGREASAERRRARRSSRRSPRVLEDIEGVEILYETEAVDLVTDERGAITGITARGRDGYLAHPARARGDPRLRRLAEQQGAHGPVPRAARRGHAAHRTRPRLQHGRRPAHGDRRSAAASPASSTWSTASRTTRRTTYPDAVVLSYPYGILVNGHAQRFLDEGVEPLDRTFEAFSYEIWRNQENEAYLIGDQSMVTVPFYELLNTTDKEPETADTLGELAEKLGLDPAALEATVAEFNAAASDVAVRPDDEGRQGDAGASRPPKTNWAQPLERGPFVGYPLDLTAVCFVFGGVRTDAQARVVSPAGAPIPGLYAAGELTGVFYRYYPVGTSVLRGLTFGRIAGAHAAKAAAREVAAV